MLACVSRLIMHSFFCDSTNYECLMCRYHLVLWDHTSHCSLFATITGLGQVRTVRMVPLLGFPDQWLFT